MVQLQSTVILCLPSAMLHCTKPVSELTSTPLYCCAPVKSPVLGMSHKKVTSLGSNLASVTNVKELKLHTVYAMILEAIEPLQLVGQAAQFKFESKFEATLSPCQSSDNLSEGCSRR